MTLLVSYKELEVCSNKQLVYSSWLGRVRDRVNSLKEMM